MASLQFPDWRPYAATERLDAATGSTVSDTEPAELHPSLADALMCAYPRDREEVIAEYACRLAGTALRLCSVRGIALAARSPAVRSLYYKVPFRALRFCMAPLVRDRLRLTQARTDIGWIALRRVCERTFGRCRIRAGSSRERALLNASLYREYHTVAVLLARSDEPPLARRFLAALLFWAVCRREHHIAGPLLQAAADPNVTDWASGTPALVYAARNDDIEMIQLLLEHGADVEGCGLTGVTALHEALVMGKPHIANELFTRGAAISALAFRPRLWSVRRSRHSKRPVDPQGRN